MGSDVEKVSETYIVPWALPKENIPLRVMWPDKIKIDYVRLTLADDLKMEDVLNADEVKVEGNVVTIKPKSSIEGRINYFGMIVSLSKIYDDLKILKKIDIHLLRADQIIDHHELYARIFRPHLEVVSFPKTIELRDNQKTKTLPLHIKYSGFGDIQMKIVANIGGRIVSQQDSVIYEIIRRLWLSGALETPEEKREKKKEVWISPDYVRDIAEQMREIIDTGVVPIQEIDNEAIEEIKLWLSNVPTQDKLIQILYSRVEDILLGLLVELLEKYPTNNVKLSDPRTSIRTKIHAPIEDLTLRIIYKDLLENEYPPFEVPIKIVDKREKESGFQININIRIEKWQDEPFLNVKEMVMR